jgi:hypothetical protein
MATFLIEHVKTRFASARTDCAAFQHALDLHQKFHGSPLLKKSATTLSIKAHAIVSERPYNPTLCQLAAASLNHQVYQVQQDNRDIPIL